MQGHPQVIDCLKDLLRGELAARDQYFAHSRNYQDQGFQRLFERLSHEMEEETQHADALMQRLLMLGAQPDMKPKDFTPATTVPDMLAKDLATEYEVRQALKDGAHLCESLADYVSRDILVAQLHDTEEDHAYWLEKQLALIDRIGLPNYLQSQLG
ncbi:MAG: bacterioferritin [Xenophilus sp.]